MKLSYRINVLAPLDAATLFTMSAQRMLSAPGFLQAFIKNREKDGVR